LGVGNYCYVVVCSAALGASALTERGEGRGIWWRPPADSLFLPRDAMRKRGLCCRPMSVCPSDMLVYCIHVGKDTVKLLSQPGSTIILVFRPQYRYRSRRGIPSAGAHNTLGVGKICDFRRKSPFISESVRDRPMVTMER